MIEEILTTANTFTHNLFNFSKIGLDYQLIITDVWLETFAEINQKQINFNQWQHFIKVWCKTFDQKFTQKFGSENAAKIQGQFLNTVINHLPYQEQSLRELLRIGELIYKIPTDIISYFYQDKIKMGITPKTEIYRENKMVLYRFNSQSPSLKIPVLIIYALVNRPEILDFQKGRSFIANLIKFGFDVYLIDWGYPTYEDRYLTLDNYINDYINNCVDIIRNIYQQQQINLLGICQGGTLSLCYTSLYPEKVKNLITMVTPVNFYVSEGLLNIWSGYNLGSQAVDIDLMVDMLGNIPGSFLSLTFLMLKPLQLGVKKYIDLMELFESEDKLINFLTMEKWVFDSPDQAGEAFRQFVKDFYQGNKLIYGNLEIGKKRVDLSKINIPVLNIYAQYDHLIPPNSSLALEKYIQSYDYQTLSFPVGHIGMFVSSRVQDSLTAKISQWLNTRM